MFWKWKLLLELVLFKLQSFKFSFNQFGMHLTTTWDAFHSPNAKHCQIYLLSNIFARHKFVGGIERKLWCFFPGYDHALHIQFIWLKNRQNLIPAIEQRERKTWTPTTKLKTKFINLWCIPNLKLHGRKNNLAFWVHACITHFITYICWSPFLV
jgi:hypothetical protein